MGPSTSGSGVRWSSKEDDGLKTLKRRGTLPGPYPTLHNQETVPPPPQEKFILWGGLNKGSLDGGDNVYCWVQGYAVKGGNIVNKYKLNDKTTSLPTHTHKACFPQVGSQRFKDTNSQSFPRKQLTQSLCSKDHIANKGFPSSFLVKRILNMSGQGSPYTWRKPLKWMIETKTNDWKTTWEKQAHQKRKKKNAIIHILKGIRDAIA